MWSKELIKFFKPLKNGAPLNRCICRSPDWNFMEIWNLPWPHWNSIHLCFFFSSLKTKKLMAINVVFFSLLFS